MYLYYLLIALVFGMSLFLLIRRTRAKLGGFHAGDFVKVAIPRTAAQPLAMGTRLDIAAALKKAGTPAAELRSLINGKQDQELIDRYWALSQHSSPGSQ